MSDQTTETPQQVEARLAWYQVITVQESVTPPAISRPAQQYCWDHNLDPAPTAELEERVARFESDAQLRSWIQTDAAPHVVYTLWRAVNELGRCFYLLDDGEEADKKIVAAVRERPGARAIFVTGLNVLRREELERINTGESEATQDSTE